MSDYRFNIDSCVIDQKGTDTVLEVNGWVACEDDVDIRVLLMTSEGQKIPVELKEQERPDVIEELHKINWTKAGIICFSLIVKDIKRFEEKESIELCVEKGDSVKKIKVLNMKDAWNNYHKFIMQLKVEGWNLDEEQATVRGWGYHKADVVDVQVKDERGQLIPAEVIWNRRMDVERAFGVENKDKRNFGFLIKISKKELSSNKIIIRLYTERDERIEKINLAKKPRNNEYTSVYKKVLSPKMWYKGIKYLSNNGIKATLHKIKGTTVNADMIYQNWFLEHRVTESDLEIQRKTVFELEPKISIVIPLYNTHIPFLKAIIDSVLYQSYKNWELCLADGSTIDDVEKYIQEQYQDERIKYKRLEKNEGIAGNTNAALDMASGDFIMLSDHDDLLELDALFEIVKAYNEDPSLEIIYTDEDLTDETGERFYSPRFKPDFNIDFLQSINYICHIFIVKKDIMKSVGGFRKKYDGAQDWDMILRCCELSNHIGHIPKILYHWRAHAESTAGNVDSKQYAIDAGRQALADHFERIGMDVDLEYTNIFVMFRANIEVLGNPKVSIIIPNKDLKGTLENCVNSIIDKSTYRNYEIIIVENNSTETEVFDYYKDLESEHENIKVVKYKGDFNYSKINNYGAQYATGDYYILLNNDTEVITPNWIEKMLGYCQRDNTGIVGAKLYYPDDTVQHCGAVIGVGGFAGHILTMSNVQDSGYFGRLQAIHDVSAVTAACLMVKKSVFDEVEGLTEDFKVALNDMDFCLKVRKKGYLIVQNPGVELYHYESKSRGFEDSPEKKERFKQEIKRFRDKWKDILTHGDPYYNVNLTLMYGDCRLRGEDEHFDIVDEIEQDFI